MEAVGRLTGGIAHDFNNLLTVVIGNIALARDSVADEHVVNSMLGPAMQAAERGADLTRRLLAFSRRQTLRPSIVRLPELVESFRPLVARTLGEAVVLDLKSNDEVWPVLADAAQIETALVNLCLNARDAMPGGGRITVSMENTVLSADPSRADRGHRPRRLRGHRRQGRRRGNDRRGQGKGVRTILHHEAHWQGQRARPEHGVRLRQAVERTRHADERTGSRHHGADVLPTCADVGVFSRACVTRFRRDSSSCSPQPRFSRRPFNAWLPDRPRPPRPPTDSTIPATDDGLPGVGTDPAVRLVPEALARPACGVGIGA